MVLLTMGKILCCGGNKVGNFLLFVKDIYLHRLYFTIFLLMSCSCSLFECLSLM